MKVVADTGPIIALAKIDRLSLLGHLFISLAIPPRVHKELMAKLGLRDQGYWLSNEILALAKRLAGE